MKKAQVRIPGTLIGGLLLLCLLLVLVSSGRAHSRASLRATDVMGHRVSKARSQTVSYLVRAPRIATVPEQR